MGPGPTHPVPNYFWIFWIFLTLQSPLGLTDGTFSTANRPNQCHQPRQAHVIVDLPCGRHFIRRRQWTGLAHGGGRTVGSSHAVHGGTHKCVIINSAWTRRDITRKQRTAATLPRSIVYVTAYLSPAWCAAFRGKSGSKLDCVFTVGNRN